jgi:hypothetical protein
MVVCSASNAVSASFESIHCAFIVLGVIGVFIVILAAIGVIFQYKIFDEIVKHIKEYEVRVQGMQQVPRLSHARTILGTDGGPTRSFISSLFNDNFMAIAFLKDIGLLRKEMLCESCGRDMTWSANPSVHDGFIWRCNRGWLGSGAIKKCLSDAVPGSGRLNSLSAKFL